MNDKPKGALTLSQIRKFKIYYSTPTQSEQNHAYEIIRYDCYSKGKSMYGDEDFFSESLEKELSYIKEKGKSYELRVIREIMNYPRNKDYPVIWQRGALPRGSIVLYLLGLSNINPLPPHYRCKKCRFVEEDFGEKYAHGFDLPDRKCPLCGRMMVKDGHDIRVDLVGHEFGEYPTVLGINKSIIKGLQKHIDSLFGTYSPLHTTVDCIHLQNEVKCKKWGKDSWRLKYCWSLGQRYGDKKILKKVLDNYVDERIQGLDDSHRDMAFWKSLKDLEKIDFGTLVRLWGYTRINKEKHLENLFDKNKHAFLEECSEEERKKLHGTGLYTSKAVCVENIMERCFEVWRGEILNGVRTKNVRNKRQNKHCHLLCKSD